MRIGDTGLSERNWINEVNSSAAVSSPETQTAGTDSLQAGQQPENQLSPRLEIPPDKLELSSQALDAFRKDQEQPSANQSKKQPDSAAESKPISQSKNTGKSSDDTKLTPDQQSEVRQLQSRDAAVRTHELQHMTAAGSYAMGGPQYDMQTGPDQRQYAIGGHVNLDVSAVPDDPQATISKAQVIQRAALAPADPSGADRAVAASASQMEAMARMELTQQLSEKRTGQSKNPSEITSQKHNTPYTSKANPKIEPGRLFNVMA